MRGMVRGLLSTLRLSLSRRRTCTSLLVTSEGLESPGPPVEDKDLGGVIQEGVHSGTYSWVEGKWPGSMDVLIFNLTFSN